MSAKQVNGKQQDVLHLPLLPPVIPHITANIIPLSTILKNYTEESYKELTQLLSTLQSSSTSDVDKKKSLLLLLVKLRENFIRLYVLNKWSVNSKEFGKLIDLLNWLRLTIEQISFHSIWGLKNLNSSLTSAKLPNPDLITSLEVLLNGRPKLPSYNFLPEKKLSPQTILNTLKSLNVSLAFRLSLLDELPLQFYRYEIKDGKVFFNIDRNFQCCLSIADDTDDRSQFFLIDFKFNFSFKDNSIVYEEETSLFKTHHKLENAANQILLQNRLNDSGGLVELHNLFSRYSLNYKLFLIHRQLIAIRAGYWKSQISHTYSADKNVIIIHYWLKLQHSHNRSASSTSSSSASSYIEISITDQNSMQLKWVKDNEVHEIINDFDLTSDELSIETLLTNVTEKHVNLKITEFYENIMKLSPSSIELKPSSPSSPTLSLTLQLTSTKNITLSISPLSGLLYFINPTPLLASLLPSLNQVLASDLNRLPYDLLAVILKTNFELLDSLMKATDWLPNNIRVPDTSKIVPSSSSMEENLHLLHYYRRPDWPRGWFLISCLQVDSTSAPVHIKWFVLRIKLSLGAWTIQWCDQLETASTTEHIHELLNELSVQARSKLLSQLITEDLESNNAQLKPVDSNNVSLPILTSVKVEEEADQKKPALTNVDGPTLLIKNSSIFNISNCHDNLIVRVELDNLNSLKISIFGKLKNFRINELHDSTVKEFETTTLDYSPETNIFKVKSIIDGGSLTNNSAELTAESIISSSTSGQNNQQQPNQQALKSKLLASSVELLSKFSRMLEMLELLSKESINIVSNNLTYIEFEYTGGVRATLDISNSPHSISFDEKNPHQLVQIQVSDFLDRLGLLKTLRILKISFPIVNKLSELSNNNKKGTLIIHELNYFKMLYANIFVFMRVDYNKRIVLIKFEPFQNIKLSPSIKNDAIRFPGSKITQFLELTFPLEKFQNRNLIIINIDRFDDVIDQIYKYLVKEFCM